MARLAAVVEVLQSASARCRTGCRKRRYESRLRSLGFAAAGERCRWFGREAAGEGRRGSGIVEDDARMLCCLEAVESMRLDLRLCIGLMMWLGESMAC